MFDIRYRFSWLENFDLGTPYLGDIRNLDRQACGMDVVGVPQTVDGMPSKVERIRKGHQEEESGESGLMRKVKRHGINQI